MQFNSGDSGSRLQSEINITPLVDVVLVLLIIFMVIVPLLMQGYDVDIPRSSAAAAPPDESADVQVVLSVAPEACPIVKPLVNDGIPEDCLVTLADQEIPAADLPQRMGELLGGRPADKRVLFLAADDRLNYEGVLRIIDLATSSVEELKIEFIEAN
jgi:biopolymer transport protein ExbD